MGLKPQPMVPLSYPSEWLLDIFNNGATCRRISRQPYIAVIQTPTTPWVLDYGWHVIAGAVVVGGILIYLIR